MKKKDSVGIPGICIRKILDIYLTPDNMAQHAELPKFVGDRNLDKKHVAYLRRSMEEGSFLWEHVTLAVCWLGRKMYRLNGNHVSHAVCDMPVKFKSPRKVHYVVYEAKAEDAMRQLYNLVDEMKRRTKSDKIKGRLYKTKQLKKIDDPKSLEKIMNGFNQFLMKDIWNSKRRIRASEFKPQSESESVNELAKEALGKKNKYVLAIAKLLGQCESNKKHAWWKESIAMMFLTYEYFPKDLRSFWNMVITGAGMKTETDPRWRLRELLQNPKLQISGGSVEKITGIRLYQCIAYAFVVWKNGQPIRKLAHFTKSFVIPDVVQCFSEPKGPIARRLLCAKQVQQSPITDTVIEIVRNSNGVGIAPRKIVKVAEGYGFNPHSVSTVLSRQVKNGVLKKDKGLYFIGGTNWKRL